MDSMDKFERAEKIVLDRLKRARRFMLDTNIIANIASKKELLKQLYLAKDRFVFTQDVFNELYGLVKGDRIEGGPRAQENIREFLSLMNREKRVLQLSIRQEIQNYTVRLTRYTRLIPRKIIQVVLAERADSLVSALIRQYQIIGTRGPVMSKESKDSLRDVYDRWRSTADERIKQYIIDTCRELGIPFKEFASKIDFRDYFEYVQEAKEQMLVIILKIMAANERTIRTAIIELERLRGKTYDDDIRIVATAIANDFDLGSGDPDIAGLTMLYNTGIF